MDGFGPGRGGCGGACESYAMWREHYYWNHMSDDKKQFLVVASDDFRHSMHIPREVGSHLRNMISESEPVKLEAPNGREYPVEVRKEFGDVVLRSGWNEFVNVHHIEENDSILFMYRGNSSFKVHVFNSAGHERFLSCSQQPSAISGAVPPFTPCDHHVLNEQVVPNPGHVTTTDFDYTMLPGCRLTKAQDEKVLKIARTMRSEIPLYVAAMSKSNVNLKNCYVYIPLRLVDTFKEEITKATVQLEAPDNGIYSVGASKHGDDLIVIKSGWTAFVASLHIQENDLLIFRSKGKTRLEVLVLDPSGRDKTSSCSVMGNHSSSTQEMCNDSVQIVDPPPHQVCDLSSSDDDDILREGTRESCRSQNRVTRSCTKTRKMASTSSPSAKSGHSSDDSVQIVDPPPHQVFDLSSSDDDDILREGTRESCRAQNRVTRSCTKTRKMASTSSPSAKSGYGARKPHDRAPANLGVVSEPPSSNLGGASQRRYILAKRTTLPLQVVKKVEEKVQEIRSELPILVRVMTTANVGGHPCEMVFCMEYASACLPDKCQPLLLQLEGKREPWHATLRVSGKQRRIGDGWKRFARDNQLKAGDICLFQLASHNTRSLTMTVHLIRNLEAQM